MPDSSITYGRKTAGMWRGIKISGSGEEGYILGMRKPMPETELLIRKAETLPSALFEEAVHYIDYLSQKAQSAYFTEKLAEAEHEASKPNAVWLDENEFWSGDD
jgi:hypothetical protein